MGVYIGLGRDKNRETRSRWIGERKKRESGSSPGRNIFSDTRVSNKSFAEADCITTMSLLLCHSLVRLVILFSILGAAF
jgi:hypothetical protein